MVSEQLIKKIQQRDPVLASRLRAGEPISHKPQWVENDLTETRDATTEEAKLLAEKVDF